MRGIQGKTLLVALISNIAYVCAFQDLSPPTSLSNPSRYFSLRSDTALALHESSLSNEHQDGSCQARRSFLKNASLIPFVALPTLTSIPSPAQASGGATAGGAYLLSAKKRYYERVKESVTGLLKAADALKDGDSKVAKEYFASEDGGSWKDLTAAGYLLSNAFRRSSSTAPDSLPAVKKYKAFAKEVENFQKVLKKKGASAASGEFTSVEVALDDWLSEIELPPAREL